MESELKNQERVEAQKTAISEIYRGKRHRLISVVVVVVACVFTFSRLNNRTCIYYRKRITKY